jgi:KAP family P-loop domain
MPVDKFTFKNSGSSEFNDRNYDRLFDLTGKTYQFIISPKTQYWRFGIRFSETPTVNFYHPATRNKNPDQSGIELKVGTRPSGTDWQLPNNIEFGHIFMPNFPDGIYDMWSNYTPQTDVEVNLRFVSTNNLIFISYRTADGHYFETTMALFGYRYFKLFAWAEWTGYEVDCLIRESGMLLWDEIPATADSNPAIGYWLLKLNPERTDIQNLVPGSIIVEGIENSSSGVNVDPGPFGSILVNSKVVGYDASGAGAVACVFDVVTGLNYNPNLIFPIQLLITTVFKPSIPLELFKTKLLTTEDLSPESAKRLIALMPEEFKSILNTVPADLKKISYRPFYMTEGQHDKTEDQLEFTNDIESIASVIALTNVNPPLAVGLFGNWGSGKSFFMEKLEERVNQYAATKNKEYVENVVQVKFNSWHYSDSNLWASLISEIFDSLSNYAQKDNPEEAQKLSETLQFTAIQREMVETQKKELENKIEVLKDDQKTKREKLEDISGIGLLKIILSDKKVKEDLSELDDKNIEHIVSDEGKINDYIGELKSTSTQVSYLFREALGTKGWNWVFVILIAAAIFIIGFFIKYAFKLQLSNLTLRLSLWVSLVTGLLSKIIIAIKPYRETLKNATDRLMSLKKTIEARNAVVSIELTDEQNQLKVLTESLEKIDQNIVETRSSIYNIISGKKLLTFIEERTKDENYNKQLGLISWIRKDFDTLDKLLREQHGMDEEKRKMLVDPINPKDVKLKIDRIVLYIDDLDRCNEDIVVKVLEAIHLLLAFELFVVIVGVDPRWLNNALDKKMSTLFGSNKEAEKTPLAVPVNQPTTSYDYLEKIFQVPFSIKPINKTGREALIKYLIKNEMDSEANGKSKEAAEIKTEQAPSTSAKASVDKAVNQDPSSTPVIGDRSSVNETPPSTSANASVDKAANPPTEEDRVILHFKPEELAFMQQLSPLFAKTPRSINRFINIYRIIRSHRSLVIEDQSSANEYFPVLFVLAIIVGYNENAPDFIKKLIAYDSGQSIKKFLDSFSDPAITVASIHSKMVAEINKIMVWPFQDVLLSEFNKNIELISRFSFRPILL